MRRTIALAVAGLVATSGGTAAALTQLVGAHGHNRAVAEDKALLADAPTLPSAVSSATSPVKLLDSAPQYPAEDQLVTRMKWWTIDEPYSQAYAQLTAHTPTGYTASGTGQVGGPKPNYHLLYSEYDPKTLPAGIASGALIVAVAPTSSTASAIGVYAQAVPQPPRPAVENVPTSVHTVVVSKVTSSSDKHPVQWTITGPRAIALVQAFDALSVQPPGESSCGADFGQEKTVTFQANGNTWVASIGACYSTAVVRDGKALPELATSSRFYNLLTRATASHRPKRPFAEHVPTWLRTVKLARRGELAGPITKRRTATGNSAAALVKAFDAMRVVPRHTVQCLVAGGPQDIVTFRTPSHVWTATESACTNVVVTRDGKALPTLIGSAAWEKDVHRLLDPRH